MSTQTATALDLKQIATDVVARAMKAGATAAEVVAREGSEFSTVVRRSEVETLKEAGSKALGVRVFRTARCQHFNKRPLGRRRVADGERCRGTREDHV